MINIQDRNSIMRRGETGFTIIELTEDKNLWHFRTTRILAKSFTEALPLSRHASNYVRNYKMRALLLATKNLCAHNIRVYALQRCVGHMSECILVVCNFLKEVRLGGWGTEGP